MPLIFVNLTKGQRWVPTTNYATDHIKEIVLQAAADAQAEAQDSEQTKHFIRWN